MLITIEKVLFLKQMPVFKNVSNMALSDLMAVSEEQTLSKGEKLIVFNKQNKNVYFILSGTIDVEKKGNHKEISEQVAVGLDSVFLQAPAEENICVKQQITALKVDCDKLYRMMALHPSLAMAILNELSILAHKQKND